MKIFFMKIVGSIFVIVVVVAVSLLVRENIELREKLSLCHSMIEAQACECRAYYQPPAEEKISVLPMSPQIQHHLLPPDALEIYNFFMDTEYAGVSDIIVAMSILETGWHRSSFHKERNNYFSTKKRPNNKECIEGRERECFTEHRSLTGNCEYVLKGVFRKKKYRTDREGFLQDIVQHRYAEDPHYLRKVKSIVGKISRGNT